MIDKFSQDQPLRQANPQQTKPLITRAIHWSSFLLAASAIALIPTFSAHAQQLETKPGSQSIDVSEEEIATTPDFAEKGYKTWYIQGSAATTLDGREEDTRVFGLVGAGLSEFLFNRHSINLEFNTLYFAQPGENAVGFNLNGMFRWHFAKRENWSIFFDSGAGILVTTNDVPRQASAFNFTPQLGGGASFRLKNDRHLLVGLRWHHISHAETFGNNPGRDSLQGYVRLDLPR